MLKIEKTLIVSPLMPADCRQTLVSMGFILAFSPALDGVQESVKYHPDMQLVKGNGVWICAPQVFDYYKQIFDKCCLKLICGGSTLGCDYPHDIAYNAAVIGDFAIHNFKYTDSVFAENTQCAKISVAQGYTKCNLCIVSDNAAITSDNGIYRALSDKNIDVLKIDAGNIILPGYDYGFIGGASGLIDDGTLAFCGNLNLHPQGELIKKFCANHGVSAISLGNAPLMDIGTIIRPA